MPGQVPRDDGRAALPPAVVRGLVNHSISHRDMPILAVSVFRRDVIVHKTLPRGVVVGKGGVGGQRQAITEFSHKSRYRLLHVVKNCDADFRSMLTLTYPASFPADGRKVKKHLDIIKKRLVRSFPGIRGVWWLEFQRRGAPHFHLLLTLDLLSRGDVVERSRYLRRKGTKIFRTVEALQSWVSSAWFELVGSGDEKHLRAGAAWEVIENDDGALRYAAAHAAKPHQKRVPQEFANVGRFWGTLGNVQCVPSQRVEVDAAAVFGAVGSDALSSRGRVRKYLWDASSAFLPEEDEHETGNGDGREDREDE